jgi:excisionase family DNA binding protein
MYIKVEGDKLIHVHHVAKRLNIPERTVRYMAARGLLPGFKVGPKLWRFRADHIAAIQQGGEQ